MCGLMLPYDSLMCLTVRTFVAGTLQSNPFARPLLEALNDCGATESHMQVGNEWVCQRCSISGQTRVWEFCIHKYIRRIYTKIPFIVYNNVKCT